MFDLINTLLAAIPFKILHENISEIEVSPNYYIRVHGDLKACEKVLVISHGMGDRETQVMLFHSQTDFLTILISPL